MRRRREGARRVERRVPGPRCCVARLWPEGSRAATPPRDPAAPRRGGFTLMEILLALTIIGLLVAAVAVNFGAFGSGRALEESTVRLETAFRMARAEAANQGRRLRLAFDETGTRMVVFWEPQPMTEPGRFAEYTACTWDDYVSMEGVRLERCDLAALSLYQAVDASTPGGAGRSTGPAAITFEPDGSSDSAVVELSATDTRDTRRAIIELEGLTGTVTSRILTAVELADMGSAAP